MAKKEIHEEHENHERWLVSYADMITLLMVLFVVMFAMATLDANKFNALAASLSGKTQVAQSVTQGSKDVVDGGEIAKIEDTSKAEDPQLDMPQLPTVFNSGAAKAALIEKKKQEEAKKLEDENLTAVQRQIQASLDEKGLGDQVKFTRSERGLTISIITDKVLFDAGSSELRPKSYDILQALGKPLGQIPNDVAVEGHTDNTPIATAQFASNWELSTSRATSVLRHLVEIEGVSARRIGATGYGSERPTGDNTTDGGRSQNRRVEVVVLSNVKA